MFTQPKSHLSLIFLFAILISTGCGTDTKPTYFTNILKDPGEEDRLSECLAETSEIDGNILTVQSNIRCLVGL